MPNFSKIINNPALRGIIGQIGTSVNDYGRENSPEWDYFQQQVADYRSGRSAYRSQRTTEGSPTFNLSNEEYKKASDEHYSGLLNQINANRIGGIGEFGLSTRIGRDDPSLINYNPNRTKAYTFSREGRMEEIGGDRISDYPDVQQETTANIAATSLPESPAINLLGARIPKGGLSSLFGRALESGALRGIVRRV